MFGMIKNLTRAAVAIAVMPADVVADAITLGGTLSDKKEPYTLSRLKQAGKALDAALEPECKEGNGRG